MALSEDKKIQTLTDLVERLNYQDQAYEIAAPIMATVQRQDGTYANKLIPAKTTFLPAGVRLGAKKQVIFVFEPEELIDELPDVRVMERDEYKMDDMFPMFLEDLLGVFDKAYIERIPKERLTQMWSSPSLPEFLKSLWAVEEWLEDNEVSQTSGDMQKDPMFGVFA